MLHRPRYMPADLSSAPLSFAWSNEIAVSFSDPNAQPRQLVEKVWSLDYKAKAALGLACLEWVLFRLDGHTDVGDPLQRVEAAWASILDKGYARSLDFDDVRDEVNRKGDPDGPRQKALLLLDDLHFAWGKSRTALEWTAVKSAHLARRVVPASSGYEDWLERTLDALSAAHPCSAGFSHSARTFDHSAEPPIPRAWFESLTVPLDEAADRAAWDAFLRGLDPGDNPYLVLADELRAEGFRGEPYRLA
ncbi:hypothetical protein HUA76_26660 [Myxococcus sp. CA056]|uniref:hypothetical protein n=1 Tax=Myxococcus sp. CA056 TaxID=2741740 RepID=UPI00157AE3F2|nr:hypothetical protein [Myxococcus sp. CA056]NTX14389.1 hypothetical protein [Myxococcus sp. CA056]